MTCWHRRRHSIANFSKIEQTFSLTFERVFSTSELRRLETFDYRIIRQWPFFQWFSPLRIASSNQSISKIKVHSALNNARQYKCSKIRKTGKFATDNRDIVSRGCGHDGNSFVLKFNSRPSSNHGAWFLNRVTLLRTEAPCYLGILF